MKYTLIAVSSITYAMKAKRLLNGMGYYCEIEKLLKIFPPAADIPYVSRIARRSLSEYSKTTELNIRLLCL